MKASSVASLLRAVAALPAAGAAANCTHFRCELCDRVSVFVNYTSGALGVTGAPKLEVSWTRQAEVWTGFTATAAGVLLVGGILVPETYTFQGPGIAATEMNRVLELEVPPGMRFLQLAVREAGDTAHPGTCGIAAAGGMT